MRLYHSDIKSNMLSIGVGVWRVHNTILVVYVERKGVRCLPRKGTETK